MSSLIDKDKKELCETIEELVNIINNMFEENLVPYKKYEWFYNSKTNAQVLVDSIKQKP